MSKPKTISLPKDLHDRINASPRRINISKICALAIQKELDKPPLIPWYNTDFIGNEPATVMIDPNHTCGARSIIVEDIKMDFSELGVYGSCVGCSQYLQVNYTFHNWFPWGQI